MKVQHDALNASCPNEEFCTNVPNDERDRGLVNVERVGYAFQLQEGDGLQRAQSRTWTKQEQHFQTQNSSAFTALNEAETFYC